jgi:flagellar hook-associated protein 3 FlgL
VSATQSLVNALTVAVAGDAPDSVTAKSGSTALQSLATVLNASMNGEYLFAGTNTDVRPLDDYMSPSSPAKAAFDAAFLSHFGFAKDDPAAAGITAADIGTFMTAVVEPQFLGAGWEANWSNATDQTIVSRIALNETTQTSVSANNEGLRKVAMAATLAFEAFSGNLSEEARKAVAQRAQALAGEAVADLGQLQSQTGIIQNRVSDASTRINTQIDLFEKHILDLEGVDPYEAANRVNDLMSHIQTSFALTARIQQLSLLNYL